MSFVQRQIQVSFSMAQGNFQPSGGNSATITALQTAEIADGKQLNPNIPRITALITMAGGDTGCLAEVAIWGMPLSQMNQLSTVGTQANYVGKNEVTISAGDADSGMQLVFQGTILQAWVDAQSQPNVCFRVHAASSGYVNAQTEKPTSVKGQADAGQLMGQLAQQAGFQFNNMLQGPIKLRNPYLWGSIGNQIRMLARHGGFEHIIDRGTLSIWKANEGGASGGGLLISPQTGMVGYPAFNSAMVIVRILFNASVRLNDTVTIQSQLTPACGQWKVAKLEHEIESNMPRGKWFTIIGAYPLNSLVGTAG